MAIERTLAIIKPNAVEKNCIGEILSRMEERQLRIAAAKMVRLTRERAEGFYIEHKDRPFFQPLVQFMTSGPSLLLVLEGENAISIWRELMGPVDLSKAAPGTIRRDFADTQMYNAAHGSDSTRSAEREIAYFFEKTEIQKRC